MELRKLFYIWVSLFFVTTAPAQTQFESGKKAYEEEEYQNASDLFLEHITAFPLDAEAFYNLGNAYYKQKKYPHAIWAYEKCLKIKPNHEDALFNVRMAYEKTGLSGEWKSNTGILYRLLFSSGKNFWAILTLIFLIPLGVSLFYFFFATGAIRKRLALSGISISLILALLTLGLSIWHYTYLTSEKYGIVTLATTNAKASPSNSDKTLFSIPGGQRVKLIRENEEWVEIRLTQDNVGWIKKSEIQTY